jgi:hypothetical protein
MVFVNQYFDYSDLNQPIKKFLDDKYYIPLNLNFKSLSDFYVRPA